MNKFDKLYNLILESIITQDIQSKTKKAIQTLIKSGQLEGQNDPRAEQVKAIIKRNNSIDINGKTKLDQLLKQNEIILNRAESKKDSYLDSIKQFSQKKVYDKGVVIYRVQQSKAGMYAVRDVIDKQLGYDANPWCLVSRNGNEDEQGEEIQSDYDEDNLEQAWENWNRYNAYPKHIAFQNGKLIAFSANDQSETVWWDRNDHSSKELKLLDGSYMKTDKYKYETNQKRDLFIKKNNLKFNKKTQRWDSDQSVVVTTNDIVNGHFPVKFGIISVDFDCSNCNNLQTLQGAPQYVGGVFDCDGCKSLTSLIGAPEKINGSFICSNCPNLVSLQGAPKEVGGDFHCFNNHSLTSLIGASKKVGYSFLCNGCKSLTSFKGAPEYIGGWFYCYKCPNLKITDEDRKKYKIIEN